MTEARKDLPGAGCVIPALLAVGGLLVGGTYISATERLYMSETGASAVALVALIAYGALAFYIAAYSNRRVAIMVAEAVELERRKRRRATKRIRDELEMCRERLREADADIDDEEDQE